MTADELIAALQALPARDRKLPVVAYEIGSLLVELAKPRVTYRDRKRCEARAGHGRQRVIIV